MKRFLGAVLALAFLAAFPLHAVAHAHEGAPCAALQAGKAVEAAPAAPALAFDAVASEAPEATAAAAARPAAAVLPPSRAPPR